MKCPVCKTDTPLTPREIEVLLPDHPTIGRVLERIGRRVAANGYELVGLMLVSPQEGILIAIRTMPRLQPCVDIQQWVTWRFRPDECEPYWGSYYTNYTDAVTDYTNRMKGMLVGVQR